MAAPHIAGAAALLKEQHPTWTVEEIKSALVQTADPVLSSTGVEVPATREGGGFADLVRANVPLLFASPTSVSFGELPSGGTCDGGRRPDRRGRRCRGLDGDRRSAGSATGKWPSRAR